jgi:hypothetical protein
MEFREHPDDLMEKAEEEVQKNWDLDWKLKGNNCQSYTDAVVDEILKQQWGENSSRYKYCHYKKDGQYR